MHHGRGRLLLPPRGRRSLADHLRAELVVDALEMAVARRRRAPGLVHHSHQGSQYVSLALGQRCRWAGIELSMGTRGCAYDNAVCEAFFKTLKSELVERHSWPTKLDARHAVFDSIPDRGYACLLRTRGIAGR